MALAALCVLFSTPLLAHPWGGLVVDGDGNIYFTFTCPMEGDGHTACVYRIAHGESTPQPWLVASSDPSDLVLARSPSRDIYAAERVGSSPFRTRLWRLSSEKEAMEIIPFSPPERFSADPYAVTDNGEVYFARDGKIVTYDAAEGTQADTAWLDESGLETDDRSIRLMQVLDDERLALVNGDTLIVVEPGESAALIAQGLREPSPPNLPFSGGNILFDMAGEGGSTWIAYYGNREVLAVSPDGEKETILQSEPPWSPHGVDVFEGKVYVLESTTPPPAWKFWQDNSLVPRIRVIDDESAARVIYAIDEDAEQGK